MEIHATAIDWRARPIDAWSIRGVADGTEYGLARLEANGIRVTVGGRDLGVQADIFGVMRVAGEHLAARRHVN